MKINFCIGRQTFQVFILRYVLSSELKNICQTIKYGIFLIVRLYSCLVFNILEIINKIIKKRENLLNLGSLGGGNANTKL